MDKPKSIKLTIILIIISWLASLISILIITSKAPDLMPNTVAKCISFAVTTILMLWLAYKINKGRNWARVVYSVLVLISLISTFINFQQFWLMPFEFVSLSAITNLSQLGVLLLLFTKNSNIWFKNSFSVQYT
ncbi:hypothetical protein ATS72_003955 [Pseudoalteromonas sp. 13-15]|jgi:phosphoglycerol transferase MdoB-like AlkP superfamily enzyme|uniref:hypothetical protein n=1 Tax=Pseudoalteromonas TaxID=53246 RepID=UPI00072FBD17|nr:MULTISPECIES: hypothetical protein [Pseudoalteromonas]AUL72804.1 hypothetical protein ATS72_003955 [Pseudoalteromonas sp. 13-15]WFO20335.1 hypothetical protein ATS73_006710 [Pseudoalteromonas sp. H100]SIN80232.1 hypothetical protein SAMN05878071_0794 [Pseudoalteromonas marina]|tara:strand:+ start:90 stop:488 length:399 start_codon:yes stop_codon:yes gene_type:complete